MKLLMNYLMFIAILLALVGPVYGQVVVRPDPRAKKYEDPVYAQKVAKIKALEEELSTAKKDLQEYKNKPSTPSSLTGVEDPLGTDVAAQALTRLLTDDEDKDNDIGVKVRRSVRDKATQDLPALFQYSHPGNGNDTWSVDVGVATEFDLREVGVGLYSEYHYNNALGGKQKDTFLGGGALDFGFFAQAFRATAAYKSDNLKSGKGLLSDLSWYPYFPEAKIGNRFGYHLSGGWVQLRFSPLVGVQFESGNGAEGFSSGDRFSFRTGFGLVAALAPKYFGNRLTLDSNYIYWHHLNSSGGMADYADSQWHWVTNLTYWFNTPLEENKTGVLTEKEQHFGITLGYSYGDNPDEGDFDADLLTVGFSVKF